MQIELHPDVAKNLLNYLQKAKERSEFVIKKKEKYPKQAVERAERNVALLTVVCNALNNVLKNQPASNSPTQTAVNSPTQIGELEKRIKDLEFKMEQAEIILKKLVSYHSGEIK